jgi:hypothetical protein
MEFINSDKVLDKLVKNLSLNISKADHDFLINELYWHIEHTRRLAYYNGYKQGEFDSQADTLHKGSFTLSNSTK